MAFDWKLKRKTGPSRKAIQKNVEINTIKLYISINNIFFLLYQPLWGINSAILKVCIFFCCCSFLLYGIEKFQVLIVNNKHCFINNCKYFETGVNVYSTKYGKNMQGGHYLVCIQPI